MQIKRGTRETDVTLAPGEAEFLEASDYSRVTAIRLDGSILTASEGAWFKSDEVLDAAAQTRIHAELIAAGERTETPESFEDRLNAYVQVVARHVLETLRTHNGRLTYDLGVVTPHLKQGSSISIGDAYQVQGGQIGVPSTYNLRDVAGTDLFNNALTVAIQEDLQAVKLEWTNVNIMSLIRGVRTVGDFLTLGGRELEIFVSQTGLGSIDKRLRVMLSVRHKSKTSA